MIKLLSMGACLALLYAPVIKKLVYDWIHLPDFSHGFLIPLLSAYFVYDRRKYLSILAVSGHWIGIGVIIFGILLLFLGTLATEYFTTAFSLIVVIGGMILFLFGKTFLRILFFPLIFLIFMIPIPSVFMDRITFPLQLFASRVAVGLVFLTGIPVLREGNIIQLANTSIEVAEACSGIRSLISLLAVAVVFAYFTQKSIPRKLLIMLCIFPIAIFANAIRVAGTAILAHRYGDSLAQGFFHGFSGWMLFVVAFICLFIIGTILSKIR